MNSVLIPNCRARQLVDQRDVHGAEDVLQQLRELRCLWGRDADDLLADEPIERLGAIAAFGGEAADHLRRVGEREVGAPGIDALGTERQVEVLPSRREVVPISGQVRNRTTADVYQQALFLGKGHALPGVPEMGASCFEDRVQRCAGRPRSAGEDGPGLPCHHSPGLSGAVRRRIAARQLAPCASGPQRGHGHRP